ncbi:hypothetical protein HNY73_013356 [Argiope bruennichi]|uniref:Uncharacterized protein n=1 Tax=Argiope bruennichi TaxID=94029 RepID=A0A8T0F3Q3_ARGBR|nr:hypothetical protein HNY73_013356 [Argiope bruennichi]
MNEYENLMNFHVSELLISLPPHTKKWNEVSDFEDIKTKCILPGNNPFLNNFVATPIELKATNPFLDNFDDFVNVKRETNPFKTDIYSNEKTVLLYLEVDEPPEIDPSWFEIDEPELIEIFENAKNIFSVLDNPLENDFATNPFLARNPFKLTNKNPFKESIIANNNPFSGISNEQKMSEQCPKEDNLTLVASRRNHYLKRKVNKVASWWLKTYQLILLFRWFHSFSHTLKTYYLVLSSLVVPDLESRFFVILGLADFPNALSPRRFLMHHLSLSSRRLQACSVTMALLLPSRRLQKEPVSS